jgi:hypothetical protein
VQSQTAAIRTSPLSCARVASTLSCVAASAAAASAAALASCAAFSSAATRATSAAAQRTQNSAHDPCTAPRIILGLARICRGWVHGYRVHYIQFSLILTMLSVATLSVATAGRAHGRTRTNAMLQQPS